MAGSRRNASSIAVPPGDKICFQRNISVDSEALIVFERALKENKSLANISLFGDHWRVLARHVMTRNRAFGFLNRTGETAPLLDQLFALDQKGALFVFLRMGGHVLLAE